jgi:hypothetical protein
MDSAFQYVIKNKGIGSEASYKYTARDGTCKKVPSVVTISSFTDVTQGDEKALATAIQRQPVSIAIEADQSVFQFYHGPHSPTHHPHSHYDHELTPCLWL